MSRFRKQNETFQITPQVVYKHLMKYVFKKGGFQHREGCLNSKLMLPKRVLLCKTCKEQRSVDEAT
ncbi:hypothetical protein PDENDC454_01265 [Paenibacillus dendritiformis C454]|uniref:Uncharacterized protein n=1 Tax=Paenibacillus dendritiformis C454 TaxID=1131935 RepID=H3S9S0_9BACL|nr:hypothetical protein PDENDC454_01265 [Paenibacillus dendritiformis C454]